MARALTIFDAINTGDRIGIVCVGDSITGYNNFGGSIFWPYITFPDHLQQIINRTGAPLLVANGGVAGKKSDIAEELVGQYLRMFPNSRHFILGFGTNDMAGDIDVEESSRLIIMNLSSAAKLVRESGKQPLLFNVPYINESRFPKAIAEQAHLKRDYHNAKLADYCAEDKIPLADICSKLRDEHFGDCLHPNETGAKMIAEEIYSKLKGYV